MRAFKLPHFTRKEGPRPTLRDRAKALAWSTAKVLHFPVRKRPTPDQQPAPVQASPDPIFAAIETHKALCLAVDHLPDHLMGEDSDRELDARLDRARAALPTPTTFAGFGALARHVEWMIKEHYGLDREDETLEERTLSILLRAAHQAGASSGGEALPTPGTLPGLWAEWQALERELDQDGKSDEQVNTTVAAQDALTYKMAAAPVTSFTDLATLAQLGRYCSDWHKPADSKDSPEEAVWRALSSRIIEAAGRDMALPEAPKVEAGSADAELIELLRQREELRAAFGAMPDDAEETPEYVAMSDRLLALDRQIVATPATSLAGIKAKARTYRIMNCGRIDIWRGDDVEQLGASITLDVERLGGEFSEAKTPTAATIGGVGLSTLGMGELLAVFDALDAAAKVLSNAALQYFGNRQFRDALKGEANRLSDLLDIVTSEAEGRDVIARSVADDRAKILARHAIASCYSWSEVAAICGEAQ